MNDDYSTHVLGPRCAERGSAMVVVMIILVALLGAGAVALRLQTADTRSSGLVREARDSLYCAEAGLSQAKLLIAAWGQAGQWNTLLTTDQADDPVGYPVVGDGFEVVVVDNDDGDADLEADADQRVFIVSTCTRNNNSPRTVRELVQFEGVFNTYENQSGQGAWNNQNIN